MNNRKTAADQTRRHVLKGLAGSALALTALPILPVTTYGAGKKTLILFFSRSGNTRKLATMIHARVGGDLLEVQPAKDYPQDYDTLTKEAKKEQQEQARPALATKLPNLDAYSTIFLGYPNWWGTMPMFFFTLLETHDFSGKTIVPFCTHGGSRLGRSEEDIKRLCPKATVLKGFSAFGKHVDEASTEVDAWLHGLHIPTVR